MMSAQMLSSASSSTGTTADLAPGEKDGMRLLEAKAAEMAGKFFFRNCPRITTVEGHFSLGASGIGQRPGNIMFVRGETQGDKKDKVVNPDEIDIDDEEEEEEVEAPLEQKSVPAEVFGSLKKSTENDDDGDAE